MEQVNAILLPSCPDRRGPVARRSDFIFHINGKIVHANPYVSTSCKHFFRCMEWELSGFGLIRDEIPVVFAPGRKAS